MVALALTWGNKMRPLSTTKKHFTAIGLILAALAADASWTRPSQPQTDSGRHRLVQYCVPQDDNPIVSQGIYCETGVRLEEITRG